jgi:hypothetical protein
VDPVRLIEGLRDVFVLGGLFGLYLVAVRRAP